MAYLFAFPILQTAVTLQISELIIQLRESLYVRLKAASNKYLMSAGRFKSETFGESFEEQEDRYRGKTFTSRCQWGAENVEL